jgi:hypothetical protein
MVTFSSPASSPVDAVVVIVTGTILIDVEVIMPMVVVLPGAAGVTRSRWPCPVLVALLLFCVGAGAGGGVDAGGGEGADDGGVVLGVRWGGVLSGGVLCCCW